MTEPHAPLPMTLDQIRAKGCEVLRAHLGVVGMIRFLQQSESGWGDYTQARDQWLDNPDVSTLAQHILQSSTHPPR